MKAKLKERQQAVRLRKLGHSYPQIARTLNISKSTCSLWLSSLKLSSSANKRVSNRKRQARRKAQNALRKKREERDQTIRKQAYKVFTEIPNTISVGKIYCALLYWAEGSKKSPLLAFTNSDPAMVKTFVTLLSRNFKIDSKNFYAFLHLHGYHSISKQKRFWSKVTGIPEQKIKIHQKKNSGKNIHPGYPGCISIRYGDVKLAKEIEFLYNAVISKYGRVG